METRPFYLTLLLCSVLSLWRSAEAHSLYTIDSVSLTVFPRGAVASGTAVTLRCEVTVSRASSLQLEHEFLFLRDDVPVHSASSAGRAVVFRLAPARVAHSGTYQCSVRVQDKTKSSSGQRLTVTGLQTPVLQLSSADLYEGQEVGASCTAPQEAGPLAFHFHLEDERVKTVRSPGDSATTRLELKHVGNWKLYCSYTVTMVPDAGVSNHSNTVSAMVKALYIVPVMSVTPSLAVVEGDPLQIHCRLVRPPPGTLVFLTKDQRVLEDVVVDNRTSSLVHRIAAARPEDSGEYECKAELGNVQKKASKTVVVKEIFSRPELSVEPGEVFAGERFTVSCRVARYAAERIGPDDIRYVVQRRDNGPLVAPGGNYSATAHAGADGNYTCMAQASSLGNRFSKISDALQVRAKEPVSVPVLSVVGGRLILGQPFQLLCRSQRGSPPVTYTVLRPDGPPETRAVASGGGGGGDGGHALFNVSSVGSAGDVDGFACRAQNNPRTPPRASVAGRLRDTTTVIEPVSRPVLTVFPDQGDITEGHALTLICSVQRGTPPINFTWYHGNGAATPLASKAAGDRTASHTVTGLRKEHGGGYYCVCVNQSNDSKRSATVIVGVRMAGWKKFLIAGSGVLLLLLLLLVFLIKKGLHPFTRKKRSTELSVKPAGTRTDCEEGVTLKLVNEPANVTPGVMGRSVWSEHVSGSESDDASCEEEGRGCVQAPGVPEIQYTEVQPPQLDPNRAPVKPGTDTVYSEVRGSEQGAVETADGGSVEYAQLNHSDSHDKHCDVSHHGDHGNHNDNADHANHNGCSDNGGNGDNGDHGDRVDCAE